ncbi:MAG: hypothetical protein R3F62_18805 [Planctomycetota bacterium]
MPRSIPPPPKGGRRIPAPLCERPGCTETTRERKPYCTEHVTDHGYVQELLDQLDAIEREVKDVRKSGSRAVSLDGPTSLDLLGFLRENGARSVPRLARDLNLPVEVVKHYVTALARAGKIQTRRDARGTLRAELSEPPQARVATPTKGTPAVRSFRAG